MLTYKAGYKFVEGGVHAEVLDYPGAISCGDNLDDARQMLCSALMDMANCAIDHGESLPKPDPSVLTEDDFDIEEPIYLHLSTSTAYRVIPEGVVVS